MTLGETLLSLPLFPGLGPNILMLLKPGMTNNVLAARGVSLCALPAPSPRSPSLAALGARLGAFLPEADPEEITLADPPAFSPRLPLLRSRQR